MHITKFGHSCLLVEEKNARILIDPGAWSTIPDKLENFDAILISHEHSDHFDVSSIKKVLEKNFNAKIYTNSSVAKKLNEQKIAAQVLVDGETVTVNGVTIKAFGKKHAFIYRTLPVCDNVGFIIGDRLFHPGDSYQVPKEKIEILAIPLAAPWANLGDMLDFGLAVKPKIAFPIHDGFLTPQNPYLPHAEREFEAAGVKWKIMGVGDSIDM